ncbi:MAG: response regulator [Desulfosarcina sp.]|nr:response regulator [Desulfobacterales bacterium]
MTRKLNRIMVVDDEILICDLLEEFLTVQGYQVTTASGGEDAILKFKTLRPQMVLLDIRMPGMDGIDVLQSIKSMDRSTGVIMLSAFGDVETIQKAMQGGAYQYIQKPVEFGVLLQTLQEWQELVEPKLSD